MTEKKQPFETRAMRPPWGDEKGAALVIALIFLVILILLGSTAVFTTTTDSKISSNYKASEKARYVAEAGAHEARERLRTGSTSEITDAHTTTPQWTAYIGTDTKSQKKGYDSTNSMHNRVASLQTDLDYTVKISHQLDPTSGDVLFLGDEDGDGDIERHTDYTKGDPNIYLIESYGSAEGGTRIIQMEVTKVPPITIKAALYSGTGASILGSATDIRGEDSCGSGIDLPGITTPQAEISSPITVNGNPSITGAGGTTPNITYSENPTIDVQSMVDALKGSADFSYTVSSATHTDSTTPGPGDGWGTPIPGATPEDPSSCSESNIVHYDTGGTYIKLSGGASGCGILLIEGDLEAHGGFSWYGPVVVTGSFTFTGGGDTNITGAVVTGEQTDGDIIGGNTNIVYCSTATESFLQHALRILSWKEDLDG